MIEPATCPLLKRGEDYAAKGRWPCVMLRPVSGMMGRDLGAIYEFCSDDQLLARHDRGKLSILKGYASDGYSPVIRLPFGKFLRLTPTPKAGMWPALGHDLTRQFVDVEGCPWARLDTDTFFYNWLVVGGTSPDMAGTYYGAVAGPVGDAFIKLTRKPDPHLWIKIIPYA